MVTSYNIHALRAGAHPGQFPPSDLLPDGLNSAMGRRSPGCDGARMGARMRRLPNPRPQKQPSMPPSPHAHTRVRSGPCGREASRQGYSWPS